MFSCRGCRGATVSFSSDRVMQCSGEDGYNLEHSRVKVTLTLNVLIWQCVYPFDINLMVNACNSVKSFNKRRLDREEKRNFQYLCSSGFYLIKITFFLCTNKIYKNSVNAAKNEQSQIYFNILRTVELLLPFLCNICVNVSVCNIGRFDSL